MKPEQRRLGLVLLLLSLAALPWAWQEPGLARAWAGLMALCGPA